jgi:hypothetical protein
MSQWHVCAMVQDKPVKAKCVPRHGLDRWTAMVQARPFSVAVHPV